MFSSLHTVKDKVKNNSLQTNNKGFKLNFNVKEVKKKFREDVSKTVEYENLDYSSAASYSTTHETAAAAVANNDSVMSATAIISNVIDLFMKFGLKLGKLGKKLLELLFKKKKFKLVKKDKPTGGNTTDTKKTDDDKKKTEEKKKEDEKKEEDKKKTEEKKKEEDKKKTEEKKKEDEKKEEDKKKTEEKKKEEDKKTSTKNEYKNIINKAGVGISSDDIKSYVVQGNNIVVELVSGTKVTLNAQTKSVEKVTTADNEYYYKNGHISGSKNPVSIFSDSANKNGQYGGAQQDFTINIDKLANDKFIKESIKTYFGSDDAQTVRTILESIECCGCNFVAVVTAILKEYEGREEDFYNTFGYEMYTVDENGNVDFNYERLIVEEFCYFRSHSFDYESDGVWDSYGASSAWGVKNITTGINDSGARVCFEHLRDKYNLDMEYTTINEERLLSREEIETYLNEGKSVVICTNSYNVYNTGYVKEGSLPYFSEMGYGGHAMTITGFDEYGNMLVSTWGNEFTISVQNPEGAYWTYYEIIG